jgi:hypothetical protein
VASSKDRGSLYFSRSSATVPGDIFVSGGVAGGAFGAAVPVTELNDPVANDIQPNRAARTGKRSSSPRTARGRSALRTSGSRRGRNANQPWSGIANLGSPVNTTAAESRPSLSRDGRQLLFGRAPGPEGMSDIYVATRPVAKRR